LSFVIFGVLICDICMYVCLYVCMYVSYLLKVVWCRTTHIFSDYCWLIINDDDIIAIIFFAMCAMVILW